MTNINEILKIENTNINNEFVNTINARTLHNFLEIKRQFADWIKDRLQDFIENQDFILISQNNEIKKRGGDRKSIDYFLTLDTAKHISMIERNEKGKQARQYFIECEKAYRLNPLINPQPQPTSIQYFYLTSPHYFCQPYFRWKKEGEQYLMCVNDLLMLTDFYETCMPDSLTRFRETTNCKWQTTEKDKVANKILFFCDFSYVRDFLYLRNNTKYRVLRVNVEREFKKTIAKLEFANNELDLTVSNNKILIEYLNEQKTLEIQELKNQLIKKDETIKLIADETSSRNTKLKIKANIVLNVNTFVFKSGYSHLDVYVYAYKQLFLMHPNVNWREEFFTSNNKLDYLMNKNISYLKELESLVLDLNLSQEQNQTVSR